MTSSVVTPFLYVLADLTAVTAVLSSNPSYKSALIRVKLLLERTEQLLVTENDISPEGMAHVGEIIGICKNISDSSAEHPPIALSVDNIQSRTVELTWMENELIRISSVIAHNKATADPDMQDAYASLVDSHARLQTAVTNQQKELSLLKLEETLDAIGKTLGPA